MMAPKFLALNAAERAVRNPLIGSAVIDDMNCKPATQIAENGNAGHRLAFGPEVKLLKAIRGQICPADFDGVLEEPHSPNPSAPIVALRPDVCPHDNTCAVIVFPDSQRQRGVKCPLI
jgi:hypothetical protein